jgi:hypothetical protein
MKHSVHTRAAQQEVVFMLGWDTVQMGHSWRCGQQQQQQQKDPCLVREGPLLGARQMHAAAAAANEIEP